MSRKAILLAVTLLLLSASLAGACGCIRFSNPDAAESDLKSSEIGNEAQEVFEENLEAQGRERAVELTVQWLESQKGVEKVTRGEGSLTVEFKDSPDILVPTDPRVWPK